MKPIKKKSKPKLKPKIDVEAIKKIKNLKEHFIKLTAKAFGVSESVIKAHQRLGELLLSEIPFEKWSKEDKQLYFKREKTHQEIRNNKEKTPEYKLHKEQLKTRKAEKRAIIFDSKTIKD